MKLGTELAEPELLYTTDLFFGVIICCKISGPIIDEMPSSFLSSLIKLIPSSFLLIWNDLMSLSVSLLLLRLLLSDTSTIKDITKKIKSISNVLFLIDMLLAKICTPRV